MASETTITGRKELVRRMTIYLNADMWRFIATIAEAEREDFFDGRNSDLWMAEFGRFLQQPREYASND